MRSFDTHIEVTQHLLTFIGQRVYDLVATKDGSGTNAWAGYRFRATRWGRQYGSESITRGRDNGCSGEGRGGNSKACGDVKREGGEKKLELHCESGPILAGSEMQG